MKRGSCKQSALAALGLLAFACGKPSAGEAGDAGVVDYTNLSADTDPKALIYNLVGRWFPDGEIQRLNDDTMTPEAWCAREPTHIHVMLDEVEVQCDTGRLLSAAIARVDRPQTGGIRIVMRAKEDSDFKALVFEKMLGPTATLSGSPCFPGKTAPHARFPKFETLQRQILSGRRCAQIMHAAKPAIEAP